MDARQLLATLSSQRTAIESEMEAITAELMSPGTEGQPPVGLKGNLIDNEGFPRADIDIMHITTLRNRLAVLNTDLSDTMKQMDRALLDVHAMTPLASRSTSDATSLAGKARRAALKPFATAAEVFSGSPAAEAGLKTGDGIVIFDTVDEHTVRAQGFGSLATLVSPGRTLKVTVDPADGKGRKTVFLTPKPWSGQGMLGCRLVPV